MEITPLRIILILHLLISFQNGDLSEATERIQNSINGGNEGHDHLSHMQHHQNQMDPSAKAFFHLKDLKKGNTMKIYFPNRDKILLSSSSSSSTTTTTNSVTLTKEEADKIPFSSKQLPQLLQRFSFSKGSPQAVAMEETLNQCELKPIKGEIKFCATSIDSMFDFARDIFETTTGYVEALSTTYITGLKKSSIQKYTIIENPLRIWAPKMVACHTMPYPYTLFYCHYQDSESRVFKVKLVEEEHGDHGDHGEVEAIAVCHMDTSLWSSKHVSFSLLGTKPGESPVCHFFPADHLVLVPDSTTHLTAVA